MAFSMNLDGTHERVVTCLMLLSEREELDNHAHPKFRNASSVLLLPLLARICARSRDSLVNAYLGQGFTAVSANFLFPSPPSHYISTELAKPNTPINKNVSSYSDWIRRPQGNSLPSFSLLPSRLTLGESIRNHWRARWNWIGDDKVPRIGRSTSYCLFKDGIKSEGSYRRSR